MKKFVAFMIFVAIIAAALCGWNYYVTNYKWEQIDMFPQRESLVFVSRKGKTNEYKVECMTMLDDLSGYALPGDEEDYEITAAVLTATLKLELPDGYDQNVKQALLKGGLSTK